MSIIYLISTALITLIPLIVNGDESPRIRPMVTEMRPPGCPGMVRISGVSGTAKFFVRTDGHRIISILDSEGPPMLLRQIPAQLLTWRFEDHQATDFSITFRIKIVHQNPCDPPRPDDVHMALPSLVEITAYSRGECDPVLSAEPTH